MDRSFWTKLSKAVLPAMQYGTLQEWLAVTHNLERDLTTYHHVLYDPDLYLEGEHGEPSLREMLIWAYSTILHAPPDFLQQYKNFSEDDDLLGAMRSAAQAEFAYTGPSHGDREPIGRLLWASACLRLIDDNLASIMFFGRGKDPKAGIVPAVDWLVKDYACFVAPVQRSSRARVNKPFVRRAMLHHAILPSKIGSYDVSLLHHNHLTNPARLKSRQQLRYGSAVFDALELSIRRVEKPRPSFVVESLAGGAHHTQINHHLSAAHHEKCDVLMWPELTMPNAAVRQVTENLRNKAIYRAPHKVPLVMVGSWHLEDGNAKFRNRAQLLNGRGNGLVEYDKRMIFRFPQEDGKTPLPDLPEAIEPGNALPVIVMEDRLVAVAICLDFCEDSTPPPYHYLDVDLVLVTSMGMRNTMGKHVKHADTVHTRFETDVFIVQQTPVVRGGKPRPQDEALGYSILWPAGKSSPWDQNEAFVVHDS